MKRITGFIVLFSLMSARGSLAGAPGPANPEDDSGWVTFGLGTGFQFDFTGLVSASLGRDRFWQAILLANQDFSIGDNPDRIAALGLNYGHSIVNRYRRMSVSAGPAFVFGKVNKGGRGDNDNENKFKTIGLILKSQLIFTPVREIGVGLDLFVNLNPEISATGFAVTFVLEGNK